MVLNDQLTVQHLDHLHVRPCIARSLNAWQATEVLRQRYFTVLSLATLRVCLKHVKGGDKVYLVDGSNAG